MSFYKPGEYEAWVEKKLSTIKSAIDTRKKIVAYIDGEITEQDLVAENAKKQSKPVVEAIEKIDKRLGGDESKQGKLTSVMQGLNAINEELVLGRDPNHQVDKQDILDGFGGVITVIKDLNTDLKVSGKMNAIQRDEIIKSIGNISVALKSISDNNNGRFDSVDENVEEVAVLLTALSDDLFASLPETGKKRVATSRGRTAKSAPMKAVPTEKAPIKDESAPITAESATAPVESEKAPSPPPPPPPTSSKVRKVKGTTSKSVSDELKSPPALKKATNVAPREKSPEHVLRDELSKRIKMRRANNDDDGEPEPPGKTKEEIKRDEMKAVARSKYEKNASRLAELEAKQKSGKTLRSFEIKEMNTIKAQQPSLFVAMKGTGTKKTPARAVRNEKGLTPQQFVEMQKTGVKSKNINLGSGTTPPTGRRPYLIVGQWFGNLKIDKSTLLEQKRLVAHDGAKQVMSRAIDASTLDLLTKNYNSKKTYSPLAWKTFGDLLALSDLSVAGTNGGTKVSKVRAIVNAKREKKQSGGGIKGFGLKLYKNHRELRNRMKVIQGSIASGNNNPALLEEKSEIESILNKANASA